MLCAVSVIIWSVGLSKFSYHYEKVLKNSA